MPKKSKKRKLNIGLSLEPMKSRRAARKVTSAFHKITKDIEHLKLMVSKVEDTKDDSKRKVEIQNQLNNLESKLESIGGRRGYQDASILSTKNFKTSRWVLRQLEKNNMRPLNNESPITLLEVGAINSNLISVKWLKVKAIDILSRHAEIEECDFFDLDPKQEYQCIVNSMVINCVHNPLHRGKMLLNCYNHLTSGGYLLLALPRRCLYRSKFIDIEMFIRILENIGFLVKENESTPKVCFFTLLRPSQSPSKESVSSLSLSDIASHPPRIQYSHKKFNDDFGISFDATGIE